MRQPTEKVIVYQRVEKEYVVLPMMMDVIVKDLLRSGWNVAFITQGGPISVRGLYCECIARVGLLERALCNWSDNSSKTLICKQVLGLDDEQCRDVRLVSTR